MTHKNFVSTRIIESISRIIYIQCSTSQRALRELFICHPPTATPPTFHTLSSFVGRSNGPGQSCGTLVVHSAGWAIAIVMRDEERHKRTNIRNGVQFCRRRRGRSKWCCSMGVGWFAVNEIVAVCWPRKIFPSFFYGIKTFSSYSGEMSDLT